MIIAIPSAKHAVPAANLLKAISISYTVARDWRYDSPKASQCRKLRRLAGASVSYFTVVATQL
jgi:hypothetical protein